LQERRLSDRQAGVDNRSIGGPRSFRVVGQSYGTGEVKITRVEMLGQDGQPRGRLT